MGNYNAQEGLWFFGQGFSSIGFRTIGPFNSG